MLRQFRHIHTRVLLATLIAWLMGVATSCREMSDTPDNPAVDEGVIQVLFTITLGNNDMSTPASRVTPTDGEYDPGSGLETYIDVLNGDYRCYLFDKNSLLVCPLTVASIRQVGGENSRTYSVLANLNKDNLAVDNAMRTGCRLVFLANWNDYPEVAPGVTTIDDICTSDAAVATFDQNRSTLSEHNLIPMYGVKEFKNGVPAYINGEKQCDTGILRLLCAYAKVEVTTIFSEFPELSSVEILSVELTNTNDRAYKAPAKVYAEGDYVHGNWSEDYTPVNIPADAQAISGVKLTRTADNHMKFVAYVPEFRNINSQSEPMSKELRSRLKVNFRIDEIEHSGYVDFSAYDEKTQKATHFNIERNNWYKFTVTINARDIEWEVIVVPYAETTLNPDFGLDPVIPEDDLVNYGPVVNPSDSTILYYRNHLNQACLTPDLANRIDDPEKTIDPATGWQTIQAHLDDGRTVVYYYYDPVSQLQYAPDKKTPVKTVFSWNTPGYVIYLVLGKKANGTYEVTEDYYYNSYIDKWYSDIPTREYYDSDGNEISVEIPNPFPAP